MASTGERIARRRQEMRLTQRDLADRLGVSRGTIANWERGKHFPLRYRYLVEQVMGISLDETPGLPKIVAANLDDPRVAELWRTSLPEQTRLEMITFLLEKDRQTGTSGGG